MKATPVATYRIQLNRDFTFDDTASIADYLHKMNISHLYLSPVFSSVPGSNHGYDGTDFSSISSERGGRKGFQHLAGKISQYDRPMKIVLDIVPNHMATDQSNPYWTDILKNGPTSLYWNLYDLRTHDNKIELPILASSLEDSIKDISLNENGTHLKYFDYLFPLNEASIAQAQGDIPKLLSLQHYNLVGWTDVFHSISYRRFFDVTSLIGVRVEDSDIYDLTHKPLFEFIQQHQCIDGVRVDHIDGLADPGQYLERLAQSVSSVWIEKILNADEGIPALWPTEGTTGYEFIEWINNLLVDPDNFRKINDYWLQKTQSSWQNFDDCVWESKAQVLDLLFKPELERLSSLLSDNNIEKARLFWTGLILGLPVYRVYQNQETDRINKAVQNATARLGSIFTDTAEFFIPFLKSPQNEKQEQASREWQQLSGPVMAKGLEDTAHYRYTPLLALNEVGCKPELTGTTKEDFFQKIQERYLRFPKALNASSTHDTKRSEDARCRLYALADAPVEWIEFFEKACSSNEKFIKDHQPSFRSQYFIYQSILSVWPLDSKIDKNFIEKIKAYIQKSFREAKLETNWLKPDMDYEANISVFIDNIFTNENFIELVSEFSNVISPIGAVNALSALTLKILMHGVPDIYQGMESWEFSLVDPDNRRPVDYALRQKLISEAEAFDNRQDLLNHLSANWKNGAIKIWMTKELLRIRQSYLTEKSVITALRTTGIYKDNLIAYQIDNAGSGLIVLVPRYSGRMALQDLKVDWKDTSFSADPDKDYYDILQQQSVKHEDLHLLNSLFSLPVSILSYK